MVADGNIEIKWTSKGNKRIDKEFRSAKKSLDQTGQAAEDAAQRFNRLGNKLGFAAFQMTFLAGVAGRALQEITQNLSEMVNEGSKGLSAIGRAIIRSGFDISAGSGEAREAVDLLNNAMRTFSSGRTIFNIEEVASAFDAVGRAVNFTGTEVERAKKQIIVANEVLKLMTIEAVDAEEASKAVVKTMKIFNIEGAEMARITDTLVAVNNQSTATLNDLIASLGFGSQQAKEFGLTMEQTVATLGVIQDRIGGERGTAGRSLSILLQNISETSKSLDPNLRAVGITLRDTQGKMKPLVDIVGQFNKAMKNAGPPGSLMRKRILELINATARGERALLSLVDGFDELKVSIENAENSIGIANRFVDAFKQLPEERIKRMKNAFKSLQIELVGALSPAIEIIADELRQLAVNKDVQNFFMEIGRALTEFIIPAVKTATKLFSGIVKVLSKNQQILKLVVGGFTALLGILTALFIVGTIGALLFLVGSQMEKLWHSTLLMNKTLLTTIALFSKLLLPLFGIFLVAKGIDTIIGTLKDGFEAAELPTLALGAAMTALGIALTLLPFKFKALQTAFQAGGFTGVATTTLTGIKNAFMGIGTALGNMATNLKSGNFTQTFKKLFTGLASKARNAGEAIKKALFGVFTPELAGEARTQAWLSGQGMGGQFKEGWLQKMKLVKSGTFKGLQSLTTLGKLGLIGAAVAAAVGIGLAIKGEIDKRVSESRLFTDGFQSEHQAFWFQFKAAIATGVQSAVQFFTGIPEALGKALQAAHQLIFNFGKGAGDAIGKFFRGDFTGAIESAKQALNSLFDGTGLNAFAKELETTFSAKALAEETIAQVIKDALSSGKDLNSTAARLQEVIETTNQQGVFDEESLSNIIRDSTSLNEQNIEELVRKVLGPLLDPITSSPALDSIKSFKEGEQSKLLEEQQEIIAGKYEELVPLLESLKENVVSAVDNGPVLGNATKELNSDIDALGQELASGAITQQEFNQGLLDLQDQYVVQFDALVEQNSLLEEINDKTDVLITDYQQLEPAVGALVPKVELMTENMNSVVVANAGLIHDVIDLTNNVEKTKVALDTTPENLRFMEQAFSNLRSAADNLAKRMRGFKIKSGSSSGRSGLGSAYDPDRTKKAQGRLASGGITKGPMTALIGEAGPEAVIPLDRFDQVVSSVGKNNGGNITNNITINVEGVADETTAEDIADMVAEKINANLRNKSTLFT